MDVSPVDLFLEQHPLNQTDEGLYASLAHKGLTEIPLGVFSNVTDIVRLDLSGNNLTSLPVDLAALHDLVAVDLSGNRFSQLPDPLRHTRSLQELRAARNGLTALPEWIGDLRALEELHLATNFIDQLPESMARLERLRILDLSENFGLVPGEECRTWKRLEELHLRSNMLQRLPRALRHLSRNLFLDVNDNPIEGHLASVVEQGFPAVSTYLTTQDGVPNFEAKLILVGEGNVGKSSLVAALRGQPFVENRATTHGIEISALHFQAGVSEFPNYPEWSHRAGSDPNDPYAPLLVDEWEPVDITLNTWDFGGQEVYRITHQFFFSQRAVYLAVWRPRVGVGMSGVEHWVRNIRLRVGSGANVIVVATHVDERFPDIDSYRLRQSFPDLDIQFAAVDNRSRSGIVGLQNLIRTAAILLPHMGEVVSQRWRDAVIALQETRLACISYSQFEASCESSNLTTEEVRVLARLLHDLGYIVYFDDDDALRGLVVLQPEWLSKAIGAVLESSLIRSTAGVAKHSDLSDLWASSSIASYPRELHPYFLKLMERFDVSYRLPDGAHSLIAQLVPVDRPEIEWERETGEEVRVSIEFSDEPVGLMSWLTVRTHHWGTGRHWRDGVFLRHPKFASEALVEEVDAQHLEITVRAAWPALLLGVLYDTIDVLVRDRWVGLQFRVLLPCPGSGDAPCTSGFNMADVLGYLGDGLLIRCHHCRTEHNPRGLLSGFAGLGESTGSLVERALMDLNQREARTEEMLERVTADVRAIRRSTAQEVTDSPRLFTLVQNEYRAWDLRRLVNTRLRLRLWCEFPTCEHPCDAEPYSFEPSLEWLRRAAPYIRLVARTLSIIAPIGSSALEAVADDDSVNDIVETLELVKALGALGAVPVDATDDKPGDASGLTSAEGAGLRQLRSLILDLDPQRNFQGLARAQAPDGEYLWLCEYHYGTFSLGLPVMN